MRFCTTMEQSRRLTKAGLSPLTSDMVLLYMNDGGYVAGWLDIKKDGDRIYYEDADGYETDVREVTLPADSDMYDHSNREHNPAWSLSALVDLLPDKVILGGDEYALDMGRYHVGYVCYEEDASLVYVSGEDMISNMVIVASTLANKCYIKF